MQKKIFPVILTIALFFSSIVSLFALHNLQGNAKVINYAGVVRGATQRLIKQELNHSPNDALITKLDGIIEELQTGKGEHGLVRLNSEEFQELMAEMKEEWGRIKEEIYLVRTGANPERLFEDSEAYFEMADRAVLAAEQYSENSESYVEKGLLILNCAFVLMIIFLYMYNAKQVKRQEVLRKAEEENKRKRESLLRMAEDLREPMNDISELLYIADTETYELLFLNKAGQETFHVDFLDGQKCYKVLQGKDEPCEFCTTPFLKEGENYTWEITNPLTKRHYILKDRLIQWDGKMARMEIAFDTTEAEKEKLQLKFTMEADKMVTECVRTLYQQEDIEAAVQQVLELLGSFLSAERAYIFYIRNGRMYNDYEWCAEGITPQKHALQDIPEPLMERWIPYFNRKECVIIEDLEQIRESSPEEYQILCGQDITRLACAPLERDGKLIGYLGVDNPPQDKLVNIAPMLQTLCYFLLLARRHAESQKQLTNLSYYDMLTNFYNRNRYIEDTNALANQEVSVGIVYLDVNGLKEINDRYGHEFGDKILIESARRMKFVFEGSDFYRIGGDEFVIIAPGIEKEIFQNRLHELKAMFQKESDCQAAIGGQWVEKIDDIDKVIAAADAIMYEDKKAYYHRHPASRRYRHFNDGLLRLSDVRILQEEIENEHFDVYLQPKISPYSYDAEGAEALIRYFPEPDTLVPPGEFLPLLEEFETIHLIDFTVFYFVCKKLKLWGEQGKLLHPISVNFSGVSLRQPSFVEKIADICASYGVSPEYLEIEVTEKVHEEGLDLKELSGKLRQAGFKVAIDDFGTEYANLGLLSEVEFDVLKLDKSMCDHIVHNPRTRAIVESISEVCRKLQIQMVAEGIETEEQFSIICSCGVELVQGYYFSRPIPAKEYEKIYLNKDN
jgi:diguanylate cyclase (GGDEF)-like protein